MHFCTICEIIFLVGGPWKSNVVLEKWLQFFVWTVDPYGSGTSGLFTGESWLNYLGKLAYNVLSYHQIATYSLRMRYIFVPTWKGCCYSYRVQNERTKMSQKVQKREFRNGWNKIHLLVQVSVYLGIFFPCHCFVEHLLPLYELCVKRSFFIIIECFLFRS